MAQALLLDPTNKISKAIKETFRTAKIKLSAAETESVFLEMLHSKNPDIVLMHVQEKSMASLNHYKSLLDNMRTEGGPIRAVLLLMDVEKVTKGHSWWKQGWKAFGHESYVDLIQCQFHSKKVDKAWAGELWFRTARLLDTLKGQVWEENPASKSESKVTESAIKHLIPELHNPESGRIDAKRVADFFGIPVSQISQILGTKVPTVHKTPDSPALQDKLAQLEKIAVSLKELTVSQERLRSWLNASNPDLDGETPLSVMKGGHIEIVLQLLEDVLLGQPG